MPKTSKKIVKAKFNANSLFHFFPHMSGTRVSTQRQKIMAIGLIQPAKFKNSAYLLIKLVLLTVLPNCRSSGSPNFAFHLALSLASSFSFSISFCPFNCLTAEFVFFQVQMFLPPFLHWPHAARNFFSRRVRSSLLSYDKLCSALSTLLRTSLHLSPCLSTFTFSILLQHYILQLPRYFFSILLCFHDPNSG